VVDRQGVPDALRAGVSFGVKLFSRGPFGLSADAVGALGFSEITGWSWRAGAAAEAEWLVTALRGSAYLSAGLHWFESYSEETRRGLLWRLALGLRVLPGGRWYVGLEPLAVEHLPPGPGEPSPFRSHWAFELAFLVLGFRP
jgi:hypothetical protein